jgi:hypothetical protein
VAKGTLAELGVNISANQAPFERGLSSVRGKLATAAGEFRRLATIPFMIGGAGLTAFIMRAASAASDLQETMSKTKQVFGDSTAAVVTFADTMANKFGLVRTEVLDAASSFGLILQGAGMAAQASAELSIRLAQLAADASSFYNVPIDIALEKIRAGLSGEAEPLRAFGVLLSEAAVKAKVAAMGFDELTDATKAAARAQLIVEGLAKASGDLERTQDGLANQTRRLAGEWENLMATIGKMATGPLADLTSGLNSVLNYMQKVFETDRVEKWGQALESSFPGAVGPSGIGPGGILKRSVMNFLNNDFAVGGVPLNPANGFGMLDFFSGNRQRRNMEMANAGGIFGTPAPTQAEIAAVVMKAGGKVGGAAGGGGGGGGPGSPFGAPINGMFGLGDYIEFAAEYGMMEYGRNRDKARKGLSGRLDAARGRMGDLEQSRRDRLAQGGVMGDQFSAVSSLQNEILNDLPRQQLEQQKKTVDELVKLREAVENQAPGAVAKAGAILAAPA